MTKMPVLSFIRFKGYIFENKHVCVKDSSAEGTCVVIRRIDLTLIKKTYFNTQQILTFKINLIRIVDATKYDDVKSNLTIVQCNDKAKCYIGIYNRKSSKTRMSRRHLHQDVLNDVNLLWLQLVQHTDVYSSIVQCLVQTINKEKCINIFVISPFVWKLRTLGVTSK